MSLNVVSAILNEILDPLYDTDNGFPWRKYTKDKLLNELSRLSRISNKVVKEPLPFSITGYKCSNFFFQFERMNTPGRGGTRSSTIDFWKKQNTRIRDYAIRTKQDLFRCLNFINHAPAQFPPVTAGRVYRHFEARHVFDPYAGWGDRCIAAIALGIKYTGVDSNGNLSPLFTNMVEFYDAQDSVVMHFKKCQDVDIKDIDFDLVLSSPPFWNHNRGSIPKLVEKYNGTEPDYNKFLNESLKIMIVQCRQHANVCLHLPEQMYLDILQHVGPCDFTMLFKTGHCRKGMSHNVIYCWSKLVK
jgi:hypothetical protein